MTKITFENVAHLYLGCRIRNIETGETTTFDGLYINGDDEPIVSYDSTGGHHRFSQVKPILRKLSSLTEEEVTEVNRLGKNGWDLIMQGRDAIKSPYELIGLAVTHRQAAEIYYLTRQGFDLFGLIESGEAIEADNFGPLAEPTTTPLDEYIIDNGDNGVRIPKGGAQ